MRVMQFSLQQNAVTRDEVRFTGEVAILIVLMQKESLNFRVV
jgi:hypothetical protein